jgi:hypothetical protein
MNNVLTTLDVLLKTAVEWGVIERASCSVKLLKTEDHDAVLRLRRVRTVARDGKR